LSLPAPDLTLFLDIPPDKAKERGGYGVERYEKEEVQRRVRDVFSQIGQEMVVRGGDKGARWVEVDAGRGRDDVADVVWGHVESIVNGVEGPIERLWEDLT
jgi:dTMP kinase